MQNIVLSTFPSNDNFVMRYFEVSKDWLIGILESLDSMNERKGVDLKNFMENYIWDETWFIYELAKEQGKLISEKEE